MIIYVLDTETTGLVGYPENCIVEIAICEVNTISHKIDLILDEVVNQPLEKIEDTWIFNNSDLKEEDVLNATFEADIARKVKVVLNGKFVTSFNYDYDFGKFLRFPPWELNKITEELPCIMKKATATCKIPFKQGTGYKYPTLDEAVFKLVKKQFNELKPHRASADAIKASNVLLELLKIRNIRNQFESIVKKVNE